jgi:hypothetical protein
MLFGFALADPCTVCTVGVLVYGWVAWKAAQNKTVQRAAKTGFWWWWNS